MGGRGLGGVCDHINHFGSHIKEIGLWKAWGAAMLKGPGENTVLYKMVCLSCSLIQWVGKPFRLGGTNASLHHILNETLILSDM